MKTILSALVISSLFSGHIAYAQDVDAGKKIFKKCKACHKVGEKAKNGTGPNLNNIVGMTAGSVEGYKYSKTLKAANAAGLVWDQENLANYITNPKEFMKTLLDDKKAKPKMAFKLKDAQKRADVIAYVATFSPEPETEVEVEGAEITAEPTTETSTE